jgi:hypothetical protein
MRHLALNGTPLDATTRDLAMTQPSWRVAGLIAGFNLVACAATATQATGFLATAFAAAAGFALGRVYTAGVDFLLLRTSMGKNYQQLAIDTAPVSGENTQTHKHAARDLSYYSFMHAAVTGLSSVTPQLSTIATLTLPDSPEKEVLFAISTGLALMLGHACAHFATMGVAHRRVMHDEWRIVDRPKIRQHKEAEDRRSDPLLSPIS